VGLDRPALFDLGPHQRLVVLRDAVPGFDVGFGFHCLLFLLLIVLFLSSVVVFQPQPIHGASSGVFEKKIGFFHDRFRPDTEMQPGPVATEAVRSEGRLRGPKGAGLR
jgi:hypothetical protein